jgi:hypothetical protein
MKTWFVVLALTLPVLAQNKLTEVSSATLTQGASLSTGIDIGLLVDVSRVPGVDCTGTRDSSPALNQLLDARLGGNINGKYVIIPSLCQLRADHQVTVFGQSNFVLDGQGRPGGGIFGCNGSTGALLLIRRSGHAEIRGVEVYTKGVGCKSSFTQSILVSNGGGSGVTATDLKFVNMSIHPSSGGVAVTSYIGIGFGINGEQNVEDMQISDSSISCGNSPNSYGVDIEGGNSDDDEVYHNIITGCFQNVRVFAGGARIVNNKFSGGGNFEQFGAGGSTIWVRNCDPPLVILGNEAAEGSGQFINSNNDRGGFGCQMLILGNQWTLAGGGSIDPKVYPVNLNPGGADNQVVIGNSFNAAGATSKPIIGSDRRAPSGPLGSLVEFGNEVLHDPGGILNTHTPPFAQGTFSFSRSVDGTNSIQPLLSLQTPSSSSASCTAGQIWADASFVYVCTKSNTIKRAPLSSF